MDKLMEFESDETTSSEARQKLTRSILTLFSIFVDTIHHAEDRNNSLDSKSQLLIGFVMNAAKCLFSQQRDSDVLLRAAKVDVKSPGW